MPLPLWRFCRSSSRPRPIRRNTPSTPICLRPPASRPCSPSSIATTSGRPTPPPLTIDGKPNYNMGPVKFATVAAVFWGIAGFTVGLYIALELAFPVLNFDLPWITFGRLRPLHTSAVIFAFGGNVLIATSFYVVQRTCRARLVGDSRRGSSCSATTSSSSSPAPAICSASRSRKEYAEPEWYADLLADRRVGRLLPGLPRHHHAAHRAAHLRRQLVLSRLHPHHRGAAPRQQRRDPGVAVLAEVLHRLGRRAGRDGAVVVRPQRGRLLPHRRLPRR